jgi:hypothetical protein
VLAGAGCDQGSVSAEQTEFAELTKGPDIDQITARYKEMYTKVQQAITAVAPNIAEWQQDGDDGGDSGCCGEFSSVSIPDGGQIGLPIVNGAPIPPAEWTRAVDQVVRGYGFNSGPSDVPNRQYVTFYDQFGSELTIASDKKTDILLMSGCHLTAAAKQRGRPTPPPTY